MSFKLFRFLNQPPEDFFDGSFSSPLIICGIGIGAAAWIIGGNGGNGGGGSSDLLTSSAVNEGVEEDGLGDLSTPERLISGP